MPRLYCFILLICFISPLTVYASPDEVEIEKQKLICMYEEIDALLDQALFDETNDRNDSLVMVILTNQCHHPTRSLPRLTMNVFQTPSNSAGMLEPDDILMLTRKQLECFKEEYKDIFGVGPWSGIRKLFPIVFNDSCKK